MWIKLRCHPDISSSCTDHQATADGCKKLHLFRTPWSALGWGSRSCNLCVVFCLPGNRNDFYLHGNETFYLTRCWRKRCNNFNSWVLHFKTVNLGKKYCYDTRYVSGSWNRKRGLKKSPVFPEILNHTAQTKIVVLWISLLWSQDSPKDSWASSSMEMDTVRFHLT